MGTFSGHFCPGVVFILLGIRWTYCIYYRFFLCQREAAMIGSKSRHFRSTLTFPVAACPSLPIEAFAMLTLAVLIFIKDVLAAFKLDPMDNGQHLTMYSFFIIPAVVMIMKHYKYPIIPDADYGCLVLTFVITPFLMLSHISHTSTLEQQMHMITVYSLSFVGIMTALEMKYRANALIPMCRALGFIMNGSWLLMEGFSLYPAIGEPWPLENHVYLQIGNMAVAWHIIVILIVAGIMSMCILRRVRKLSPEAVSAALDIEGLPRSGSVAIVNKTSKFDVEQGRHLLRNSDDEDM